MYFEALAQKYHFSLTTPVKDLSEEAMDVNQDGKVNSLDGLLLMRYLNGWDVTIG
jgi:hypothetical protein